MAKLEADSAIAGNTMPFIASGYGATSLDLNGHKLTVTMTLGKCLYLCNTAVTTGTIDVASRVVRDGCARDRCLWYNSRHG